METFETYGGGAPELLGSRTRESVNELEWEGRWFFSTESAREKNDPVSAGCKGWMDDGDSRNWVICDVLFGGRRKVLLGACSEDVEALEGDGGWTLMIAGGGVGGYE